MTRSRWIRDDLYVSLGGNRSGRVRTCVDLLVVMLLGGLWHGAACTFMVWRALPAAPWPWSGCSASTGTTAGGGRGRERDLVGEAAPAIRTALAAVMVYAIATLYAGTADFIYFQF